MKKVLGLLIVVLFMAGCNPDELVLPENVAAVDPGTIDENTPLITTWYLDEDYDDWGGTTSFYGEKPSDGHRWTIRPNDCNDHDDQVNPGLAEDFYVSGDVLGPRALDRKDNNCDGKVDSKTSYMFVTNGLYDGNIGGLTGADDICQHEALDNELPPGTYKAFLSDSGVGNSVSERLVHSSEYYTLDGRMVARTWNTLVDEYYNDLSDDVNITSTDETYTGNEVWTATTGEDGNFYLFQTGDYNVTMPMSAHKNPERSSCNHWTSGSNYYYAGVGDIRDNIPTPNGNASTNNRWAHTTAISCDHVRPLICVRQI